MKLAFYGDSITAGIPGASYFQLLRRYLSDHTLINRGKINDTTLGLQRRLMRGDLIADADVALVWIGVNDALTKRSAVFSRIRRYWARDQAEFRQHFCLLLDAVCPSASTVLTVSPALIGEDINNTYNQWLDSYASTIETVTADYPNAHYLDMHARFKAALIGKHIAQGVTQHPFQSVWDVLTLRSEAALDQAVAQRGLTLTLDGVHLSRTGAHLAAAAFLEVLRERATVVQ